MPLQTDMNKVKAVPTSLQTQAPQAGMPSTGLQSGLPVKNAPSSTDFINETLKVAQTLTKPAEQKLLQTTEDLAGGVARKVLGQGVGATSGVGQQIASKAVADVARTAQPEFLQIATDEVRRQQQLKQDNAMRTLDLIDQGQLGNDALTPELRQQLGIPEGLQFTSKAELEQKQQKLGMIFKGITDGTIKQSPEILKQIADEFGIDAGDIDIPTARESFIREYILSQDPRDVNPGKISEILKQLGFDQLSEEEIAQKFPELAKGTQSQAANDLIDKEINRAMNMPYGNATADSIIKEVNIQLKKAGKPELDPYQKVQIVDKLRTIGQNQA